MHTKGTPKRILQLTFIGLILSSTSCKKDDCPDPTPTPTNEEELITTLRLNFTSAGGTENKQFSFVDLDGDGGNSPVITADTLSADSTYTLSLEVLNESVTPTEDITVEVVDEGVDHQFFFQPNGVNLTIGYNDQDNNGDPIGVENTCNVGAASTGTLTVILRHEPNKGASGVSSGDITNAGGETDIEVTFQAVVE